MLGSAIRFIHRRKSMGLVAVGQICSTANVARNATLCQTVINGAAAGGAKLIWLPEASDFIANSTEVASLAKPQLRPDQPPGFDEKLEDNQFIKVISQAARSAKVWVGVGIHERGPLESNNDKCYNTNLLFNSDGEIVRSYRKIHLFDVDIKGGTTILESNTTIPGSVNGPAIDTPIGAVGMLTCYDLRFPEPSLQLRQLGAQLLTYPSAFTMRTGVAHWEVLLRARAIETQCYVLAPAQIGSHSSTRQSYGHAMIVDPWGTVLAQASDQPQKEANWVMADVDLDWLDKIRADMPLWNQRRYDVYPSMKSE